MNASSMGTALAVRLYGTLGRVPHPIVAAFLLHGNLPAILGYVEARRLLIGGAR